MCATSIHQALATCDLPDEEADEILFELTPGEVLQKEFLQPAGLSPHALAAEIGIFPNRVAEIINGQRAITAQMALLLGQRFGTSARFWLDVQAAYDRTRTTNR